MRGRTAGGAASALLLLAACTPADAPDESGLTQAAKRELVERYYACAREGDPSCVRTTLHPRFEATDHPSGPVSGAAHAETLVAQLQRARVESRIMPHEASDVWVVEMWVDKHGSAASRLRTFTFEDRLIRNKAALGS